MNGAAPKGLTTVHKKRKQIEKEILKSDAWKLCILNSTTFRPMTERPPLLIAAKTLKAKVFTSIK